MNASTHFLFCPLDPVLSFVLIECRVSCDVCLRGDLVVFGWNASESQHPKTSVPHKTALPETQKTIGQDFGMHPAETGIWISANQASLNEMASGGWNLGMRRKLSRWNLAPIKCPVHRDGIGCFRQAWP